MTEQFEAEVRAHLIEMLKRPMTAADEALLAVALAARRDAQQAVDEHLINTLN
jgi:hypothetical protein